MSDDFNRCTFICEKKKRKCKLLAKKGSIFCGEHSTESNERVICPLDPKHTVEIKNLEKHLKKCNSRERCLGSFDIKDINSFDSDREVDLIEEQDLKDFSIQNLTEEELNQTISYLFELDKKFELSKELERIFETDTFINSQITESTGALPQKHLKQISSLVANIKNLHDPSFKCVFIEMGAGRGKLSHWLSQSIGESEHTKYLLIELGSQRYKFDNYHEDSFTRLRMDIKNLCLNKISIVEECETCIIYGKHLCGSATDYTLRCLKRTLSKDKFKGLLLALCCHHRCEWSTFCGKRFFKEININREWFYRIRSLTSWATCGQRVKSDGNDELKQKRDKIGRIAKNLIDLARIKYLTQSESYQTRLFTYCDEQVTLENRLLIVLPKEK